MKFFGFKEGNIMLSNGKKIFILLGMVVLLLVTGYLNVSLNSSQSVEQTSTIQTANFFTTCRADKIASRNYQLELYDSIISTSTDADEISVAKAERAKIASRVESELVLEGLIAASGYDDVIVTTTDDSTNVFVKTSAGLNSDEVASILSILTTETGVLAANVKIIPVE